MQNNSPSQNSISNFNYNCIDLTKFILSILIITIHVSPFGNNNSAIAQSLNYVIKNGVARIAVPIFFVISGFLLYKKIDKNSFSWKEPLRYITKIFKLYFIWSLIYLPLNIDISLHNDTTFMHDLLSYIRNFLLVGSYSQLWYLNATIFAVLMVSYFLYRRVSIKHILCISLGFYLIGLLAQSWYGIIAPLSSAAPSLWNLLLLLEKIIITTRNGLFEGMLFISIGLYFAVSNSKHNIKKAAFFLGISVILFISEILLLEKLMWIREYDMFLSLIPIAYWSFALISNIHLENHFIYKKLRILSTLIFCTHTLVKFIVQRIFCNLHIYLEETPFLFVYTLIISVCISYIILLLSTHKHWKWLKNLYN